MIEFTEAMDTDLHNRITAMSEAERVALDPICKALRDHQSAHHPDRGYCLPNRVVALAAVDLMWAVDKAAWERE